MIRPIQLEDNPKMEQVIRAVFEDMGIPKTGTAYEDEDLKRLYQAYNQPQAAYYVLELDGEIVGGAGFSKLRQADGNVCELQKMYFAPKARGINWGDKMLEHCLQQAAQLGYSGCYLETMPYMEAAQHLYKKHGFEFIDGPMGCTGHVACPVFMFKTF